MPSPSAYTPTSRRRWLSNERETLSLRRQARACPPLARSHSLPPSPSDPSPHPPRTQSSASWPTPLPGAVAATAAAAARATVVASAVALAAAAAAAPVAPAVTTARRSGSPAPNSDVSSRLVGFAPSRRSTSTPCPSRKCRLSRRVLSPLPSQSRVLFSLFRSPSSLSLSLMSVLPLLSILSLLSLPRSLPPRPLFRFPSPSPPGHPRPHGPRRRGHEGSPRAEADQGRPAHPL